MARKKEKSESGRNRKPPLGKKGKEKYLGGKRGVVPWTKLNTLLCLCVLSLGLRGEGEDVGEGIEEDQGLVRQPDEGKPAKVGENGAGAHQSDVPGEN